MYAVVYQFASYLIFKVLIHSLNADVELTALILRLFTLMIRTSYD